MTLHVHHLHGCAPTPLAHYLKGLGIMRVVSNQKDEAARGWWQDECFCLLTRLDRAELESFFLMEYAPTPFVSPWNRGSGFYGKQDPALAALESSTAPRFNAFRLGIEASRAPLAALTVADTAVRALKDRTKARKGMNKDERAAAAALKADAEFNRSLAAAERRFKTLKNELFRPCLLTWRGGHRAWMDAALVLLDEGRASWPSLLGTGGADGRLDFTNNAMQRMGDLFDLASSDGHPHATAIEQLEQALWTTPSKGFTTAAIGQFLPGGAGGANSTTGPEGDSLINPWDFLLMMEGSIPFSARSTRRLDPNASNRASAPFAVHAHTAGYGTAGREKSERGEQWMPLWTRPVSQRDLEAMLGEARLQLKRDVAHRPIDVARAVSRLGVARGISSFVRFGYLERNGRSNIAVPLGRLDVRERPLARLIDDVGPWLDRLRRLARDQFAPARLVLAERRLADAVFALLTHDDTADRWQAVLLAAGTVEEIQASGTAFKAGPIPPLAPEWAVAADDGTVELRLARALGSAAGQYDRWRHPRDPVRHHWLPLQKNARRFQEKEQRLARDARVVMHGRDPLGDLGALVERRLLEGAQGGQRGLALVAARGCEAFPADLTQLIAGSVDLVRVSALARALMAVRWDRWQTGPSTTAQQGTWPDEAWMAIRLAHLPWKLDQDMTIATDETILRRLMAGDGATAVEVALRRLRAAGIRPPMQGAFANPSTAQLWAAALAFPISLPCARAMARRLEPLNPKKENR